MESSDSAASLDLDPVTVTALINDLPTDLTFDALTTLLIRLRLKTDFPFPIPDDELHAMHAYYSHAIDLDKSNFGTYMRRAGVSCLLAIPQELRLDTTELFSLVSIIDVVPTAQQISAKKNLAAAIEDVRTYTIEADY